MITSYYYEILDPMSFAQFCQDREKWEALTSVQRVIAFREKWAKKQVVWEGEVSDVKVSGEDVIFNLKTCVGGRSSDDPDSYWSEGYIKWFSIQIPISRAGSYLNVNKGDCMIVKGSLPAELSDFNDGNAFCDCTVEFRASPPPAPLKKSFWRW